MSSIDLRVNILKNKHNINEFILNLSPVELFKDNEDIVRSILKGDFDSDGLVLKDFIMKFKKNLTLEMLETGLLENIWGNGLISKRINNIKDILDYCDESILFDKYIFNTNDRLINKIFKEEIFDFFSYKLKLVETNFGVKKLETLAKDLAIQKQYTTAINSLDKMVFRKCRSYMLYHDEFLNKITTITDFENFKETNTELIKTINAEKKLKIDYLKKEDVFLMLLTSESKNGVKKIVSNWFSEDEELRKFFVDNLRVLTKANKEIINICIEKYKAELPNLTVPTSKLDDYFIKFLNSKYYTELDAFLDLANFTKNIYIEKHLADLNRIKVINQHYSDEYIKEKITEKSNYFTNYIVSILANHDGLTEKEKNSLKNELKKKNYVDLVSFKSNLKIFDFENLFTTIKSINDKEMVSLYKSKILDEISDIRKNSDEVKDLVGSNIARIVVKYTNIFNDFSIINNEELKNIYLDEYKKDKKTYLAKTPIYFLLPDYMTETMVDAISFQNWNDVLSKNKKPNFLKDVLLTDKNFPFIIKIIKDVILLDDELKKIYLKKSNIKALKNHDSELDVFLNKIETFLEVKEKLVFDKNEESHKNNIKVNKI